MQRNLKMYTIENASMYCKYRDNDSKFRALARVIQLLDIELSTNLNVNPHLGFEFTSKNIISGKYNVTFYTEFNPFDGSHYKGPSFQPTNITTGLKEYNIGNIGNITILFNENDDDDTTDIILEHFTNVLQPFCDDVLIYESNSVTITSIYIVVNSFETSIKNDVKEYVC